jgi:hypothetical protein
MIIINKYIVEPTKIENCSIISVHERKDEVMNAIFYFNNTPNVWRFKLGQNIKELIQNQLKTNNF